MGVGSRGRGTLETIHNPQISSLSFLRQSRLGAGVFQAYSQAGLPCTLYNTVIILTVLYCTAHYNTATFCAVRYSTVQYCSVLYYTVQLCTAGTGPRVYS